MMRRGTLPRAALIFVLGTGLGVGTLLAAERLQPQSGAFATPLTDATLDGGSFAEWYDGAEHPLAIPAALRQVIWTQSSVPNTSNVLLYGVSSQPGTRHLRLGFTASVAAGSVLVRGGDQLSVLRPGAPYPGNMAEDSQWIPAQRIVNRQPSSDGVDRDSYAVWVLPAGTRTRALRFTHVAQVNDSNYAGTLGGLYVLSGRFANLSPQATVVTGSNPGAAPLIVDEKYNLWRSWDNGPDFSHPVTQDHPEWITLSWPRPVALQGLAAIWAGFNAADVEIFAGPDNASLGDAPPSDWRAVGPSWTLRNQYPSSLGINWLDFGKTVETRAVRLRITQTATESHPHLLGKTKNGNRVWLGELMAISPLAGADLKTAVLPSEQMGGRTGEHPPIPIHFTLAEPGYVSLVIDDAQGNRVRNLVSDAPFPAGSNTAWWDGSDDLGRDPDAAQHGVYRIPTHFVAPGHYSVRGIVHKAIDLRYEFSVYNAGHPAWETSDGKGGWLTNHTPPMSALFVPAERAPGGKPLVFLGSYVSEGGSGLAWVDLDGNKQGGRGWIGGSWTAAPFLARDGGAEPADTNVYAYVAATWGDDKGKGDALAKSVLRITGLTSHGDKAVLNYSFDMGQTPQDRTAASALWRQEMGGFAMRNRVAVVSLYLLDKLLFADTATGTVMREVPLTSPRGLAFDSRGNLLALSGKRLVRYSIGESTLRPEQPPAPEVLVTEGLEDPVGITTDADGNIYICDRGNSNQVKVFSAAGKFLRAIGHAGPSQAGLYDPLHMNNPRGLAIDNSQHLWVAEEDFQPKRVSLWTLDGQFVKGFYGPSEYGGGGSLDPTDKTKFYYHAMEFKLDWKSGTDTLVSVLHRPAPDDIPLPRFTTPETVLYSNGHRYFDNTYLAYPSNGVSIAVLYLDTNGLIRPVAALGKANDWSVLQDKAFQPLLPSGTNLSGPAKDSLLFTWSDTNGNGRVDPEEVTFVKANTGSINVMPDLAMIDSFVDGKAMRYAPVKVTSAGVPVYDLNAGQVVAEGAQQKSSDGGGQTLYSPEATVLTTAPTPFSRDGVGGIDKQGHRWSYPSLWPGLHPGHSAPVADHPGELEATTRLLGGFVHPGGSDAGAIWGINGNNGPMYLFTADGLYITQLFQDVRVGKPWSLPQAQRNMLLNDVSPHDENFFPSLTQTPDGNIYVMDGGRTSIVRVDGLSSVHRLPASTLDVTKEDLQNAQSFVKQSEALRQQTIGTQTLEVGMQTGDAPALSTLIDALKNAQWATIDSRITKAGWNNRPDVANAAITIKGGRLYAVFRTNEPNLLRNSGAVANAPFKSGGALDLMIGADPNANPKRESPVAGDIRLLVYQVNGKPKAMLYRAVVPGTANPVPFSSPWRTITLDSVQDVSSLVDFKAMDGNEAGSFAFSVALDVLGLKPVAGEKIKADIGILRGNGTQTIQRVYWSNKATGITSDVPSEAELTPSLWGEWIFKTAP